MTEQPNHIANAGGITFQIFRHHDDDTKEDDIVLVVREQDYHYLEQMARMAGVTVAQYLYSSMASGLAASGYNTPLECLHVTFEEPQDYWPPIPVNHFDH
jgi:hypothetical protein